MQTSGSENPKELAKRIRYYGAQIDMSLLEKGQDYEELPKRFIIFICTFDPFKKNQSIYTFRNICVEDALFEMGDETTTIFLCTNGKTEGIAPDIISFLRFVDGNVAEGAFTQEFADAIIEIKEHKEMRREYMSFFLELRKEMKKERAQGRAEGREEEKILTLRNLMDNLNLSLEKAMDVLKIPAADRAKYAALLQN